MKTIDLLSVFTQDGFPLIRAQAIAEENQTLREENARLRKLIGSQQRQIERMKMDGSALDPIFH